MSAINALPDGFTVHLPQHFQSTEIQLSKPTDSYYFTARRTRAGESFHAPNWPRVIVFIPQGSSLVMNVNDDITLNAGDSYTITNAKELRLVCREGEGLLLLAGSEANPERMQPELKRAGEHYKVSKPWGHELWLNGEDKIFSFKEVHIKQGNQTSLQYHNYKIETNFLYNGTADLIYNANSSSVSNDNVTPDDTGTIELQSPTALHIVPPTLHRLRATTDLYLYETSTPHLDDVIRVQDDAKRGDGRIQSEHGQLR